jgi:MinD-like ATPase involved in chromosome partitioning or flagellar assembly
MLRPRKRYTVYDLQQLKGKRVLTHIHVKSPEEAEQVFLKLKGCTERFLGLDLNWLGLLPEDTSVEGAVLKRAPFSEAFPNSVAARYLAKLVSSLERYLAGAPKPAPQAAKS